MKNLIIASIMAVFTLQISSVAAQDELSKREQRKLEKAEKKKLEKEQLAQNKTALLEVVNDSAFVIEANTIQGHNLNTYQVNPNTNFIKISGDEFVLQTSNPFYIGYNGLGGITVQGKIQNYEVHPGDEGKQITIRADLSSTVLGHSVLYINIDSNGRGYARLTDNWGNRIRFNGETYALENSRVYQGQSLF